MAPENRTLLIVDDEAETLKGYSEYLTPRTISAPRKSSRQTAGDPTPVNPVRAGESFRILLASSGEQALAIAQEELNAGRRIAAGFFDVKLGAGMDGLATCLAIRALDKDIHCVVVTAYHDRSIDEIDQLFGEAFKDQWDYLNKPFTEGEIVQKARQMIAAWNRKRELENLHAQLVKQERLAAVGQVARGVGHEFGNILLRIIGKADLSLIEKDVTKIYANLEVLIQAAERAGVIVRNLQSFSKAEPKLSRSNVSVPIEEALSLINHELVKNSIQVKKDFKIDPKSKPLKMDVGGIVQVLLNLMINSTHAMEPKGGTITLTVETAGNAAGVAGIAIRVKDTGSGIRDDVLPRIFEFAYTTKGDHGSGLGLSVSRDIVVAHQGELTVQTQWGAGTEFTIWLPQSESESP